jgi:protein-disulfide isomerase
VEQPRHALLDDIHSIILGNREAKNIITIVSNPYCEPCSQTHKTLDQWLSIRDDIRLQIIFSAFNQEKDAVTTVASHFISLKSKNDDQSLKRALNDWFEQKHKNYERWAEEYPVNEDIPTFEILEKHKEWCEMTNVKMTPTIFINGRKLPKVYQIEDIKYFI